jgi:hypothetical protein
MDDMLNALSEPEATPNAQFKILGSTRRGELVSAASQNELLIPAHV